MMFWPGGKLAIAHRTQLAPKRLATHRDAILLPQPLHQIDKPPAHNAVKTPNGTFLYRRDKRLALLVVQQRLAALSLSSLQPVRTVPIETLDPVSNDLQTNPAN